MGGAGSRIFVEPVNPFSAADVAKAIYELFELPGKGGLSKVVADEQTNSLIIVGTEDSYLKLLRLLRRPAC